MLPRLHIIGIAPGSRALAPEPRQAVLSCGLLVGARRHLELVPDFPGEVCEVEGRVAEAVGQVVADRSLRAGFLASGDPGFFGIAGAILRQVPRDEVRIWPAVSSMQLAFARAGETWSEARFASLHGRPLEDLAPLLGAPKIGLFTDPRNTPSAVARFVAEAGWGDLEMTVLEDLGLPSEKVSRGTPEDFFAWAGSDLNVVLLVRRGPDARPLGPGLPEELFAHSRGLITKAEVRAVALGLLRLPRQGVLWDVGAGSGSLSVEACLVAPALRAYAVEKSAEGLDHIVENRRRFRVAGLAAVAGEAPEALVEGLPDPDAVFVGGSGGRLGEILDICWARLKGGGSLVVSAVLLETLTEALTWASARTVEVEITDVVASRSRPVAGKHRMEPVNPVHLLRLSKER